MENLNNKIFGKAKEIKLEDEKKNSIRNSVLLFMKENPLAEKKSIWSTVLRPSYISIASLVLIVFIAGSVSASAQSALPGDILYPVKIGVNEKILQVLAFSDQAKTKLNIQLAGTRLNEVKKLAEQGKITKDKQEEINNNLNEKVRAIEKTIDKLNAEKKYDTASRVASDLEVSLKSHSQALDKINEIKNKNEKQREDIEKNVEEIQQKVKDQIEKIQQKVKQKQKSDF